MGYSFIQVGMFDYTYFKALMQYRIKVSIPTISAPPTTKHYDAQASIHAPQVQFMEQSENS